MRRAGTGLGIVLLLLVALGVTARAVQPVYRVAPDTIFLPLDGVALNAHTGHVLWRFPRYTGQTFTDGRGLLLLSWTVAIAPHLHHYTTRICRLRTSDGHRLWCHDHAAVREWVVDNTGKFLYLHTPGRLEILDVSDGQPNHGFDLDQDSELSLMPLPSTGVLMLARHRGSVVQALRYQPGAAALQPVAVPAKVYPFRGDGRGLLLYAKPHHEFFLAAPFRRLFDRHQPEDAGAESFPLAKLDDSGFLFTDWAGDQPVIRGGTYSGPVWHAPRRAPSPQLALTHLAAIMLEPDTDGASQLLAWSLATGERLYSREVPADVGRNPRLHASADAVLVQTSSSVLLFNAASGIERWHADQPVDTLAAIARTAVVFWDGSGGMIGLARNNGSLLWRIRFQTVGTPLPF